MSKRKTRKYERNRIIPKYRGGSRAQKRLSNKTKFAYAPCVECHSNARPVMGDVIHPNRAHLHKQIFYLCQCGAYVRARPDGSPMGYPGNRETRRARSMAHRALDPLWKLKLLPHRNAAYGWLADRLGIDPLHCHMGRMNAAEAEQVTRLMTEHLHEARRVSQKENPVARDKAAETRETVEGYTRTFGEETPAFLQTGIPATQDDNAPDEIGQVPLHADRHQGVSYMRTGGDRASRAPLAGSSRPLGKTG